MDNQIWTVLGAGSIGCLWAASLCHKGFPTQLILKNERFYSLPATVFSDNSSDKKTREIKLKLCYQGNAQTFNMPVTCPADLQAPVTRLIICTKAQDALNAIESIADRLADDCKILLLQNGMGSQRSIADTFSHLSVWAGSATDGAYLNASFDVHHAGRGITTIGSLNRACRDNDFEALLTEFRLNVQQTPDIENILWTKLAINCCINGLTALFNCKNGDLLDGGAKQSWLDQLIIETAQVLDAYQIPVYDLYHTVHHVCRITAHNVSSTCQDARMNRTTELAFINRFLLKKAHDRSIQVSSHEQLMAALAKRGIH